MDVEFIVQYLQLCHGAAHPEALHPNMAEALRRLAAAGVIEADAAAELEAGLALWHRIQAMQRLLVEHFFEEDSLPEGLRATLAESGGAADFDALKERMAAASERMRAHFERLIGPPQRMAARPVSATGQRGDSA